MKNGFNYFDTAYAYHKGNGGRAAKLAVVDRYQRENFKPGRKAAGIFACFEAGQQKIFPHIIKLYRGR